MAERVRMYAGTQRGMQVLRSTDSGWQQVSESFQDGVIDSLAGCQQTPERVFAAVIGDGLYRTEDAGAHWSRVLEGDMRAVTVDPTDDNVVYAGTEPVHLYRSEDRGDSWEELGGIHKLPEDVRKRFWFPREPHQGHVRNIFVHPDDPRTIYLAIEHGGVLRSFDRGATWEDVTEGIDYVDIHMVKSLPGSFERYFVSSARGFFTSDDPAEGWVRAENGFTRDYFHDFVFFGPRREGEVPTMLACTADKSPGSWDRPERARAAMFRSDDAAGSWHRVGQGMPDEMKAMVWALAAHPDDPNAAFAGLGITSRGSVEQRWGQGTPGSIMVTHDRGDSWQELPIALPADRVLWAAAD